MTYSEKFATAIGLWDQYCAKYHTHERYHQDLAAEVKERLRMLDFILKRVPVLEHNSNDPIRRIQRETSVYLENIQAGTTPPTAPFPVGNFFEDFSVHLDAVCTELRILTEAFYQSAWRIREIARGDQPLPDLRSFECEGVRNVRNHLIEHPEQKSKIFAQSFLFDGGQGPKLKPNHSAPGSEEFRDHGLYPNAEEFMSVFLDVLRRALGKI